MAALVTIESMKTHLYSDVMSKISRNDNSILQSGIDTAISEAKGYCSRYNLSDLFDDAVAGPDRAKLVSCIKDMAAWEIIKLSNPNINIELFQALQEKAIEWLEKVQMGKVVPFGWTYPADDPATELYNENNNVQFTSNTKRKHHY